MMIFLTRASRVRSGSIGLATAALTTLACAPRHATTGVTRDAVPARANPDQALRVRQLLNRFTFGPRFGDIDAVAHTGVDQWIDQQLHPERIPDPVADSVLNLLEITHKSAFALLADHPVPTDFGFIVAQQQSPMAERSAQLTLSRNNAVREIPTSVMLRAVVSERQVLEVMTAFWENHFSVTTDKMPNQFAIVEYDRTIRSHALGKFRDLLGAVAKSPAMLFYLDNYASVVDSLHPTATEWRAEQRRAAHPPLGDPTLIQTLKRRRTGVNENYARELLELHTLGVDGGYSQRDIQEVARCLTGWGIDEIAVGGPFAFHPLQHDAGEKTVLGVRIPAGRGIEDGEQVLDILARHPSTARFIAKKLVIRFVSDSPPPSLVERVARTYLRTDGDIREVLRTIMMSREFNDPHAYRAKVKTPFELTASILRAMNAAPDTTQRSSAIPTRLGQRIFGRSTPDGWPDQADAWLNSGTLVNRMNLGPQVAAGQIPNVKIADWKPAKVLIGLTPEQQVNGVIDALLGGDASNETRAALLAVNSPPHTLQHIGELVAIAVSSPDFQRR